METWINEQQEIIIEIKKECEGKNSALEAYLLYVLRLLNGLAQMDASQFHIYEKKILHKAMKLFTQYFIEEVNEARNEQKTIYERMALIDDIENAVCRMADVYRNVVDSTSNADRQMFTSLSIDTNVYELSPKLLMFYSNILDKLVEIYGQQELYVFLLHPSLKNNIETVNLFELRKRPGKVVLIYIPEKRMEEIREISMYLLHEAYHVLTRKERCRRTRAFCYLNNMQIGIKQLLFRGVCFSSNRHLDDYLKERLIKEWLVLKDYIAEIEDKKDEDRFFYSENVGRDSCGFFRRRLMEIHDKLGHDLVKMTADFDLKIENLSGNEIFGLSDYNLRREADKYSILAECEVKIRRNILNILAGNRIEALSYQHRYIYREIYADLAYILTLGIKPEDYQRTFERSIPFKVEGDIRDIKRDFRILIVSKVVAKIENIDYYDNWKEFAKQNEKNFISVYENNGENKKFIGDGAHRVKITEQDRECYEKCLTECAEKLWNFFQDNEGIAKFRDIIKDADMIKILSGEIEEKFRNFNNGTEKEI